MLMIYNIRFIAIMNSEVKERYHEHFRVGLWAQYKDFPI